jgi:hypothetical protein
MVTLSVLACSVHVRADGGEGDGEVVESLIERGVHVVDGEGNELHPSPTFLEVRDEGGGYLSVFFAIFLSHQPKSLQKPFRRRRSVHFFLSDVVGSWEEECDATLAYIRSGVVP